MVTTTEIINNKYLSKNNRIHLIINNEYKTVEFGEIKYVNDENNLSVINIKEKKDYSINFLKQMIIYQKTTMKYILIKANIYNAL